MLSVESFINKKNIQCSRRHACHGRQCRQHCCAQLQPPYHCCEFIIAARALSLIRAIAYDIRSAPSGTCDISESVVLTPHTLLPDASLVFAVKITSAPPCSRRCGQLVQLVLCMCNSSLSIIPPQDCAFVKSDLIR